MSYNSKYTGQQVEELLDQVAGKVTGDGVYAVDAGGKLIDYNTADSSCLGVALVAGGYKFMIAKSDATDGSNTTLYWSKNLHGGDVSGVVNSTTVNGTNAEGYLPKPDGTFGGSTHLSDDFTTWTAGALSDFNGKANTAAIIVGYAEYGVSMDTRDMCSVLNTFKQTEQSAGRSANWYVPACGQLALMYLNMTEINAALAKIGGTALSAAYYWSSSEYANYNGWHVDFDSGEVGYAIGKKVDMQVRFVRNIIIDGGNGAYPVVDHGSSDTVFTLNPNTLHLWKNPSMSVLDLSFGEEIEGVANEYLIQVETTQQFGISITLPEEVSWVDGIPPVFSKPGTYQISILNNMAISSYFEPRTDFIYFFIQAIGLYQTFTCRDGWTWGDFVESKYNNAGDYGRFIISDNEVWLNSYIICDDAGVPVKESDVIISGHKYLSIYD